ncbi:MAG: hypothetical protein QM597_06780 [Aeromicrobium sp.]|uniref:hypothetical protein n=1 Tax=Aeromicrobium sp. TaxID=1871063 RepID=UPI0039E6D76B
MAIKYYKTGPGSIIFGEPGDTAEYSSQVKEIAIEPEVSDGDPLPVLSGEELPGDDEESCKLTGTAIQDLTGGGFTTWTWENAGTVVPFVFIPNSATERQVSGEVKVRRTKIGGAVKEIAEADFEFPCVGIPTLGDVPGEP